jgi:predicted transcriptional regulator
MGNPVSFGVFLDALNSTSQAVATPPMASHDILNFLKQRGGSASIVELVSGLKIPIVSIASTLESLKQTNLIQIRSDPDESVSLTDVGKVVADFSTRQE